MKVMVQGSGTALRMVKGIRGSVRHALEGALKALGRTGCEVSVLLTDNDGIRGLNRTYRNIDKPTDVLSFAQDDPVLLGDIVVSVEMAEAQARRYSVSVEEEVRRLLIHGLLHLLGYEHVHGGRQAAMMKRKEDELMKGLSGL